MALCTTCKKDVGCGCNLHPKYNTKTGLCDECYATKLKVEEAKKTTNVDPPKPN